MNLNVDIKINEKLYLRDPKSSDLGKKIIKHGIVMIEQIGIEDFTFKKLALEIKTTEASIYRYFENKQLFLLYILSWYWQWLEYLIVYKTNNITDSFQKIEITLDVLLLNTDADLESGLGVDKKLLHLLVIKESSKSYLNHQVQKYNEASFFKAYKDLSKRIASILLEINPNYKYSKSLTTTILLMSRNLYFFMENLPSLTDYAETKEEGHTKNFLKNLISSSINN
jgi:AcrR family transcriptional regulator